MTTSKSRSASAIRIAVLVLALMGCLSVPVTAAELHVESSPAGGPPPLAIAVTPAYQFDASLNRGGSTSVFKLFFDVNGNFAVSESLGLGLHFDYTYADYHFSGPVVFSRTKPWEKLHRLEFGGNVTYDLTPEWTLFVAPSVQFFREQDAGWGNALEYGGVVSVSRDFSKDLTLGIGVGAFSELEEVSVFPMLVITWKITDRLLLSNPSRPGPTGPAGLELSYRIGNGWELAAGGAYQSERFRLYRTSFGNDSIGESSALPVWGRLTRNIGRSFSFDCYAGAMLGGKLYIDDRDGNRLTSDSYDPAPFVALAVSSRF